MKGSNPVAIVTGASSGIGAATALDLAKKGYHVVLAARRLDRLTDLQDKIAAVDGPKSMAIATDVVVRSQVEKLFQQTVESFGRLDVLVNNAGLMPLSFMKNLHIDEWERMIDVNLKGALFCIGSALPIMMEQKKGHIINVSSVAGRRVFQSGAVYCGTKFALNAVAEGLRMELATHPGIKITSIEPGAVATELANSITDTEVQAFFAKMSGMRFLQAEDIARAITWVIDQPDHVDVSEVLIMPSDQRG